MVQLSDADILTREVRDYRGVHLFHYSMSSCSQKIRIFLNLKGAAWEPHIVNLAENETSEPWFLGINPRGLVPVLVVDGEVHIESNDILAYLDARFPDPKLIPDRRAAEIAELLAQEDALHRDLRTLSFRFVYGRKGSPKTPEVMRRYRDGGAGTVQGRPDSEKQHEIDFYDRLAREGITEAAILESALKFRAAFGDLDHRLQVNRYLLGDDLTVFDIAWYVYAKRLLLAGYPLERLHPKVDAWFRRLDVRPEFSKEVEPPPRVLELLAASRREQEETGVTLVQMAGL